MSTETIEYSKNCRQRRPAVRRDDLDMRCRNKFYRQQHNNNKVTIDQKLFITRRNNETFVGMQCTAQIELNRTNKFYSQ